MAAYQVDEDVVGRFRSVQAADRDLIHLTSWASYCAVRRIGSWLA
jgi:hypothetical protein